jgi:hypothetical protein
MVGSLERRPNRPGIASDFKGCRLDILKTLGCMLDICRLIIEHKCSNEFYI